MNILNKFTLQNLKKNKKRTIVTIIGIMLSTALICTVAGTFTSIMKTLENTTKEYYGNYHVEFQEVPINESKYIENNTNVKSYFDTYTFGYSKLEDCQNESKPYLYVIGLSNGAIQNLGLKLESGRMPENDSELVISRHIISNGKVDLKIGDTITLDIGTRQTVDGSILNQNNPYQNDDNSEFYVYGGTGSLQLESDKEKIEEEIVNTTTKTYKIVGIVEKPNNYIETYNTPGYSVFTKINEENLSQENNESIPNDNIQTGPQKNETKNIFVLLNNPRNRKGKENFIKSIVSTIENDTRKTISTQENTSLLSYQGGTSGTELLVGYLSMGIIMAIIVVSSAFVIRNSFSISVSEKIKQYGMLSSIGATSKQIKKNVLFEAFLIGLIGIPLGIICGILAVSFLITLVNILLSDMTGYNFVVYIPFYAIVIACLVSIITIYFSSISSAIKASKISPIDAIRGNNDTKINPNEIKTSKLTKKIFGIGGVIASKNLKRSRKKYRTTVTSLVVSIIIFISLTSAIGYIKKMSTFELTDYKHNIEVDLSQEVDLDLSQSEKSQELELEKLELYDKIIRDNNINNYSYYYTNVYWNLDPEKYATKDDMKHASETHEPAHITICKVENNYFKKYMKELGLKGDYKETAILKNTCRAKIDDKVKIINIYNINDGDKIKLSYINNKDTTKEIQISKVTDKGPMGYENCTQYNIGYIFISEDNEFLDINNEFYLKSLYINTDNPDKLEKYLQDMKKQNDNIYIMNIDRIAKEDKKIFMTISICLYSFITVITLIGVTNIFNTITTNMILRSKEFAMLKSIGMTKKEFNGMIRLESILYGMKSLIIGVPIGVLLSYAIYKIMSKELEFGFYISWGTILLPVIFVFIIVGLTMKYSLNKINKQNIVETIRNDNI